METRDAPKLRRVRRLDCIRLDESDSTYFTDEGYLVDHPILTSCGIFEYTNPDGSIRRELRLPEHVFAEESLKTYKGKPIIITHDAGVVNKDNVDHEQIGTILSDGYQDNDDVRAEIIIHDTDAMKKSGLKELSLGYNLDLLEQPGEWNGEHYDAIQTNIVINHLALVASARAGEQARLNIDGSDEPELKGGKVMRRSHKDGDTLSPEQLKEAIAMYKAQKASEGATDGDDEDELLTQDSNGELEGKPTNEPEGDDSNTDDDEPEGDDANTDGEGCTPEETMQSVRENRDRRDEEDEPTDVESAKTVIAQQDEDIDKLLACLDKLLAEKANTDCGDTDPNTDDDEEEETNGDGSDDESKAINADSADKIVRQRLSICRVGDKLHMDGLENMSIVQGKKAIIAKALPGMRMDGKSNAYIDAMYDLAVNEINKRKDVNYQRKQMTSSPKQRMDSNNGSSADAARQRMINREGGNE